MKSAMINTRVNPEVKVEVEQILSSLGLTTSQAINIYLEQIRLTRGLPFAVQLPKEKSTILSRAKTIIAKNYEALEELAK